VNLFRRLAEAFQGKPRYLAVVEYWVYTSDPKPANVTGAVAALTRSGALTAGEAGLASDVRFFASVIRREHNPQLFRPDLFGEHIEPTAEQLSALARSDNIFKLRYLSETPLNDMRHVGFIPRLAVEVAQLKKSEVVLDNVSERLYTPHELEKSLLDGADRYAPGEHIQTYWVATPNGGKAMTRGLLKVGIHELETPETRSDCRNIVVEVLGKAAEKLWLGEANPNLVHVSCYDDLFLVHVKPTKHGPSLARIMRWQET